MATKAQQASEEGTSEQDDTASTEQVQKKIVRVDRAFEYRGAHFAPGNYYEVDDVPTNFVDWHIVRNKNGAVVNKEDVQKGKEVLPDPRPEAKKYRDAADAAEIERVRAAQGPRATAAAAANNEPSPEQVAANEASRAQNFTTTENVFGGTHSPEGSGPGVPLGGEQRHTGGSEEEKASLSQEQKEGVQQQTGQAASSRPRVPRT